MATPGLRKAISLAPRSLALGIPLVFLASTTLSAEDVFERINPGAQVRITAPTAATGRLVGTVVSVDSVGIELYPRERDVAAGQFPMSVSWTTVTHLELGQKKWGGKRALKGAGAGLLAGALFGAVLGIIASTGKDSPELAAFAGAFLFGGSGLVLGATIGALPHEQWGTVLLDKERFR